MLSFCHANAATFIRQQTSLAAVTGAATCIVAPALVGVRQNCVGPTELPELLRGSLRGLFVAVVLVGVHPQRLPPVCTRASRDIKSYVKVYSRQKSAWQLSHRQLVQVQPEARSPGS